MNFWTGNIRKHGITDRLYSYRTFQNVQTIDKGGYNTCPSPQRIKNRNDRWETGLDEEVREIAG